MPSTVAISVRDLTARLTEIAAAPAPDLKQMTAGELAAIGVSNPIMTEVLEMLYSLENPDLLDSSLTEKTFGLAPAPLMTCLPRRLHQADRVPADAVGQIRDAPRIPSAD